MIDIHPVVTNTEIDPQLVGNVKRNGQIYRVYIGIAHALEPEGKTCAATGGFDILRGYIGQYVAVLRQLHTDRVAERPPVIRRERGTVIADRDFVVAEIEGKAEVVGQRFEILLEIGRAHV